MDGTTNNSEEVGTILSQTVKIEPGLGDSPNESLQDEIEVTSCSVNAEMTAFSIQGNTEPAFKNAASSGKEGDAICPKVVKTESAPEEPLGGSQCGEMNVVSPDANGEITALNFEENSVARFACDANKSKQVCANLPESGAPELSSSTNSRSEIDTVLPVVKPGAAPKEPLNGSMTGETEVASHGMNRKVTVGVEENAMTESRSNINNSEKVGTFRLEVLQLLQFLQTEPVFREPSKVSSKNETVIVSRSPNGEIAEFEESNLLTFLDVRVKEEDEENQESAQDSCGSVVCETQERLPNRRSIEDANESDASQVCSDAVTRSVPLNGDQTINETEKNQESAQDSCGCVVCEAQEPFQDRRSIEETNDSDASQVCFDAVTYSVPLNDDQTISETEKNQESAQDSRGSVVCETQEPLQDRRSIEETNDSNASQVCSDAVTHSVPLNDDQTISETEKNPRHRSETHLKISNGTNSVELRQVRVKLEDLFPSHVRKLGLAHLNTGLCACIYCRGEYRYSGESKQAKKKLENKKRPKHVGDKIGVNQNYQRGYYGETFKKVRSTSIFKCDKCSTKFKNRVSLNAHLLVHGNPYKCKYCPQRFVMMSSYYTHLERHVDKRFKCKQCSADFWHISTFEEHLRVHSKEKPFECRLCSMKFGRNNTLQTHMRTHKDSRPFKCAQCPADFKYKSNLTVHLRLHTGEKPFKCNHCPAKFLTSTNLKGHLMRHSGEKPYKCEQCRATFRRSSSLKLHATVHSDEKQFRCKLCPERFKVPIGLKVHVIKIHKGATKFLCKLCPERFADKRTLNTHLTRHNSGGRYACAYCSAKFVMKPHLIHHLKMCH